jgi:hypothetical protein
MLRKFLTCLCIAVTAAAPLFAQDSTSVSESPFKISGSLDAYYRYSFANAKDSLHTDNYTSFTNSHNSFELGMASVKLAYTKEKIGAVLDLGFGRRAEEFSYNDANTLAAIKQAYVTYSPSSKLTFTMGKFGTHVGYEVLDPQVNRDYSMSYMFSYGPFFHTGLKADMAVSDHFGFMVGVVNPNDMVSASFAKKFFIAQLRATGETVSGYLNYVGGKDYDNITSNQFDLVVTAKFTDKFSAGYNGTVKTAKSGSTHSWWGSAIYLNVDPTSKFGITLRGEYFDDEKGVAGFGTSLFDATISLNIKPVENLLIIPEFRLDTSADPLFFKNSDTFSPSAKAAGAFLLAAIISF